MPVYRSSPNDCALHETGWAELPGLGIEVTKVPVVDLKHSLPDGTPLFARLTYDDALAVAARYQATLIKPHRIDDLRKHGVAVQLTPYFGTPTAEVELVHSERHDADVWRQLRALGWDGKKPVVGAGKHWVDGAPPGRSRLEGWDRDGAGPGQALWQPDMVAHNRLHFDDGTTTVLERPVVVGTTEPLADTKPAPPANPSPTRTRLGDVDRPPPGRVAAWQNWLLAHGYSPGKADGVHGNRTEAASLAYERATRPSQPAVLEGKLGQEIDGRAIPFIRAKNFTPANRSRIDWVVLHSTENPVAAGVAHNIAMWFAGPNAPQASSHYIVGPEAIVQCVKEADVAWAAPGANRTGIQIEQVGQAAQTEWDRAGDDPRAGRAVLERSAKLVAAICKRWNVPIVRVDAAGLLAGQRGITTHASATVAFKLSDHQDPGLKDDRRWPWDLYLSLVAAG